jgi:hypothetical protein
MLKQAVGAFAVAASAAMRAVEGALHAQNPSHAIAIHRRDIAQ